MPRATSKQADKAFADTLVLLFINTLTYIDTRIHAAYRPAQGLVEGTACREKAHSRSC